MNLRPSGYEPDELPCCSTPRHATEGNIGAGFPFVKHFFHLFSQKENKTTQCTLNTGFISLSHTGFRGFGTTCRGRPRADSYRQYRGDALKSGTRLRMLMRRKEHFEQRLRAIEHGKAGDVVIPLKEETKHPHMLRRHGDEHLVAVFGNGKPDGASFFLFHGARCSLCFSGTQGRNGIPTGPLPIHLNSQSTYNDIKRRWGKGSRCDSV